MSELSLVLLVEADTKEIKTFQAALRETEIVLKVCRSLAEARAEIRAPEVKAVILDLTLPDSFGLNTIKALTKNFPDLPIAVVVSSIEEVHQAIKAGALDFLMRGSMTGDEIRETTRKVLKIGIALAASRKVATELTEVRDEARKLKESDSVTDTPKPLPLK